MMFFRPLFAVLTFFVCGSAFAYTECEKNLMDTYLAYRSALLDVNYASGAVLKTLTPDFKEKFKSELDLKLFLLALRVKEAKVIKLDEFSAKCEDKKGELKLKILYYEPEYNRIIVSILEKDGRYYVNATTFQSEMEKLDVHYGYRLIKLTERAPVLLVTDDEHVLPGNK